MLPEKYFRSIFAFPHSTTSDTLISLPLILDLCFELYFLLKAELSERVEAELAKNQTLYSALKELQQNSNGNLAEVQSYERVVAARKKEMEKRINELQSQIGKQLDKVKQSLPSLPSF